MELDINRIKEVLDAPHSYYGGRDIPIRNDDRWDPGFFTDLISRNLTPNSRILDLGCGRGHILMEMCDSFQYGLGIDNDPAHIQMAEDDKRQLGIRNVDFLLLDFPKEAQRLESESFNMVISIRGALDESSEASFQEAYRVLRPDGLLFCQEIGELHHQETRELFFKEDISEPTLKRYLKLLDKYGFDVRLSLDSMGKMFFPDIYFWLAYVSNIWSWLGMKLPEANDPRISLFAEQNTTDAGEVMMTWHVSWMGCVKK